MITTKINPNYFSLIYKFLLIIFVIPSTLFSQRSIKNQSADIVVFSYNRPMQLYACLESIERHFTGYNEVHVIYRASDDAYNKAYTIVQNRFSKVLFHKQSQNPQADFKPLVLRSVYSKTSSAPYIMFAVDDMLATDYVTISECTKALEKYKAAGFFLRLGGNITFCYMANKPAPIPKGKGLKRDMYLWKFSNGTADWKYSTNVDMTIYRKKDLNAFLKKENYINPNTFEAIWWGNWADLTQYGLCYYHSKVINIPMNLVNTTFSNRHNHSFTPTELLAQFQEGKKIDIAQFYQVNNTSVHVDYKPTFIQRN